MTPELPVSSLVGQSPVGLVHSAELGAAFVGSPRQ